MKNKSIILVYLTTLILLVINRVLIFFFDSSFKGYYTERLLFFSFIFSGIILLKSKIKFLTNKTIVLSIFFILSTNFLRGFYTSIIYTNDEIYLNKNFSLRESTSLETIPFLHIIRKNNLIERSLSDWHSPITIDTLDHLKLSDIDSVKILKQNKNKLVIKFFKNKMIKLDTFNIE